MYRIVRLSSSATEQTEPDVAVIASGFPDRSAARFTADNWLRRHCPQASYDEQKGCWSLADRDGWTHWFFVEQGHVGAEQSAA